MDIGVYSEEQKLAEATTPLLDRSPEHTGVDDDLDIGLSSEEALALLEVHGYNEVSGTLRRASAAFLGLFLGCSASFRDLFSRVSLPKSQFPPQIFAMSACTSGARVISAWKTPRLRGFCAPKSSQTQRTLTRSTFWIGPRGGSVHLPAAVQAVSGQHAADAGAELRREPGRAGLGRLRRACRHAPDQRAAWLSGGDQSSKCAILARVPCLLLSLMSWILFGSQGAGEADQGRGAANDRAARRSGSEPSGQRDRAWRHDPSARRGHDPCRCGLGRRRCPHRGHGGIDGGAAAKEVPQSGEWDSAAERHDGSRRRGMRSKDWARKRAGRQLGNAATQAQPSHDAASTGLLHRAENGDPHGNGMRAARHHRGSEPSLRQHLRATCDDRREDHYSGRHLRCALLALDARAGP
eukprot:scaffold266_cov248-Pinguiococcus_pyrenoidosus.AAC.5